MSDIIHRIGIKSSATEVYNALSTIKGLANWWTEEVEGDEQVGGKIAFTFRSETGDIKGQMVMQVQNSIPKKMYSGVAWTAPLNGLERISLSICHSRMTKSLSFSGTGTGVRQLSLWRIAA